MNWLLFMFCLIVFLLLSLVGLELGCRWWLRRRNRYYVWPPYLRLELHPDREVFPELERRVRFEINSDGERGNEPPPPSNDLYRILVAGGSPVECGLLDQPSSWPCALENILKIPENLRRLGAKNVHVGNIGRSGIASAHLNLIFRKLLPRYQSLSTIIIMVGGNDVWDWLKKGAPVPYEPPSVSMREVFSIYPEKPFGWKPTKLALKDIFIENWRRFFRPIKTRWHSGKWVGAARAMRANATEIRQSVSCSCCPAALV